MATRMETATFTKEVESLETQLADAREDLVAVEGQLGDLVRCCTDRPTDGAAAENLRLAEERSDELRRKIRRLEAGIEAAKRDRATAEAGDDLTRRRKASAAAMEAAKTRIKLAKQIHKRWAEVVDDLCALLAEGERQFSARRAAGVAGTGDKFEHVLPEVLIRQMAMSAQQHVKRETLALLATHFPAKPGWADFDTVLLEAEAAVDRIRRDAESLEAKPTGA